MNYRRLSNQVILGTVVILVGVVLLLRTTGLYDTGPLLRYVPSLFVLVGLYAIVASGFRNLTGPVVVVVVAGTWQLVALGVVRGSTVLDLWPVLLILLGLSIVLGRLRPRPAASEGDYLSTFALFGAVERRATSPTFRGADLMAIFGGTTLDLRDVERSPGSEPVRLNTTALFGGAEIVAPREWNVRLDALPILGSVEDSRLRAAPEDEHEGVDLVVDGLVAFGGIEVKD
jgi:hypothetical protein